MNVLLLLLLVATDHLRFDRSRLSEKVCLSLFDRHPRSSLFSSYLILVPKLLQVGDENPFSVFITPSSNESVRVRFDLRVGEHHIQSEILVGPGQTRNGTLTLPGDFPIGVGELLVRGEGGEVNFEEKHPLIIHDHRDVLLVQTSASTYRPSDRMKIRVLVTDEHLIPRENNELIVEIYDAALKLVGRFDRVAVRSGLSEMIEYPLGEDVNAGPWLVSATLGNTTSSIEVLVSRPVTPSFDVKAIFERFLLRQSKFLRGSLEMHSDRDEPIFGQALISIAPFDPHSNSNSSKEVHLDIAGRVEFHFDLLSQFHIDLTEVLAIEVKIRVFDLSSGDERVIRQVIPIFSREVIYDIHPLEFEAAMKNEFEVMARRPDGKPTKMEDLIVNVTMYLAADQQGKAIEEKSMQINEFYTRGRNDLAFFNVDFPENCLGVLMTIIPIDADGQRRDFQSKAVPLMPLPRRHRDDQHQSAKLSIELLPSTIAPLHTDVKVPVVSSQISVVGRTSHFYIQVIPGKAIDQFESLPMSFVLLSNGRVTLTGQFEVHPTKECQMKSTRSIRPEESPHPLVCLFNGTLPIRMTREMLPYSTLIVYSFQSRFGYNLAQSYRFAVAGLFQSSLTINASIVPHSPTDLNIETNEDFISPRSQDRHRVELSLTGSPNSLVGVNVFEYDAVLHGLTNELTKERLIKHLLMFEDVPLDGMTGNDRDEVEKRRTMSLEDEQKQIQRQEHSEQIRYPLEKVFFGIPSSKSLPSVQGDDLYLPSSMNQFYSDASNPPSSSSHFREKFDMSIDETNEMVVPGVPSTFVKEDRRGTSAWFEKIHSQLKTISPEALIFVNTPLTVLTDIPSLAIPSSMTEVNLTRLITDVHLDSWNVRDSARQSFEDYLVRMDRSLLPPPIVLDEISRLSYSRSIFFATSELDSRGTAKMLLPRTKPFASWMATGFALNSQSGLSIAQPIRLPRNEGLFVIGRADAHHVRVGERVLLAYAIHNYLARDVNNVRLRIHPSPDFDLLDEKDSNVTFPLIKDSSVETRDLFLLIKRQGVLRVILEVESEFGGDYESVLLFPRETGIEHEQINARLFDLTNQTSSGPIVEEIQPSADLRSLNFIVSANGFDRLLQRYPMSSESFVGIDRALVRLYRAIDLRQYLNETSQLDSSLYKNSTETIVKAYQELQMYNNYDGSYSRICEEITRRPSLYLTSLAFGVLNSPLMPFHDRVTLNRTLTWILSQQDEKDGSFVDPANECFHSRFCQEDEEFHREPITALVLYSLTHNNHSDVVRQGVLRAQTFLKSRVPEMKPHFLLITLVEMAFIQSPSLFAELRSKIREALASRPMEVDVKDESKHLKSDVDDQVLLNALTTSIFASYDALQTSIDFVRWLTKEMGTRPRDDTLIDAIFRSKAYLDVDRLFRRRFSEKKIDLTIEVAADQEEKKVFKIDAKNVDLTQSMTFKLPVKQLSFTVKGFGLARVSIIRTLVEKEVSSNGPFQLNQEFRLSPSMNETQAKTCLTYNSSVTKDHQYNRTIAVDVQLPSSTRANLREIAFLLSAVPSIISFHYEPHNNKMIFLMNIPSTMFNKEICFEWVLKNFGSVVHWSPVVIHAYDYLRHNVQSFRLIPLQFPADEHVIKAMRTARRVLKSF